MHCTITKMLLGVLAPVFLLATEGRADGWGLPENISTFGGEIDHQFNLILVITTITFIVTMTVLVIALIRFRHKEGKKAQHVHGSHKLEIIWTLVPAAILLFLAFYQTKTWALVKMDTPDKSDSVVIQVFAKQFEWNFRYAGTDGIFDTEDDPCTIKELYVPVNKNVILEIRSLDVIHSLFLPHLRFKQDVIPGMRMSAWFQATKTTLQARSERGDEKFNYEIACTELCGIEHHTMKGTLSILAQGEFDTWLAKQSVEAAQFSRPEIWDDWERAGGELEIEPLEEHADH